MTQTSDFSSYMAKTKSSDKSTWLGSIIWYTVSETRVKFIDMQQTLTSVGLKDFIPRAPRNEDVFRRVAPNGHKRRIASTVPDVHINYRIHQVKRGGGVCVKHIVAETVDSAGERLSFEPVYELKYVEGSTTDLTVQPLTTPTDTVAESIANDVMADYQANRGWLDATAIRTTIRRVMEACKATNVRPTGGVYFVMNSFTPTVEALEKFAETVDGSQVHSLPLIADEKQREMVQKAFEAESVGEIEAMLAEISQLLGDPSRTLDVNKYASLSAKFSHALAKTQDYENLLENKLDTTNAKLAILRKAMAQLLMRTTA